MGTFELLAVLALIFLAFGDLIVGVTNDAVNFLNSAIGARVASRKVILGVAAIGILIGATFSDGIIEVARKGIFYPTSFGLEEVILIFTGVAIADVILLDLYSTFGLPTSTTVSVVFELLGAALAIAFWKFGNLTEAWGVINSASATKIILGIVLSVGIAFTIGLIGQFITRLLFTFDYKKRLQSWGFIWCGFALSVLTYFIILKGGKHASFMTDDVKTFISDYTWMILGVMFVLFSLLSLVLVKLNVNVLKIIILIGTGALAMAFAGNDLANFIGVSVGGVHAYFGADLSGDLATPTSILVLAGLVMVFSIYLSKKAGSVVSTSINLSSSKKQVTGDWKSFYIVEKVVDGVHFVYRLALKLIPQSMRSWVNKRWDGHESCDNDYDLVRASVNLMVAAAVISYATSQKLPLSTTYVTFMVAMGTSLADKAWGKNCAPYRVTGVFTVVGGWFMTAFFAFVMAGITASILFFAQIYGLVFLFIVMAVITFKLYRVHHKRRMHRLRAGAVTTIMG